MVGTAKLAKSILSAQEWKLLSETRDILEELLETEEALRDKTLTKSIKGNMRGSRRNLLARRTVASLAWRRSKDPLVRRSLHFSSVITREGKWYVASCPELEIASQGKTVELSSKNLGEAIELYLKDEDAKVPDVDYRPIVAVVKVVRA
jgi:predicted RNase H-like HicB family nuclease